MEGKSKKIVPLKNTRYKCQFWSDFKKIYIFEIKMKTGLNALIKPPKFEKKFECDFFEEEFLSFLENR